MKKGKCQFDSDGLFCNYCINLYFMLEVKNQVKWFACGLYHLVEI